MLILGLVAFVLVSRAFADTPFRVIGKPAPDFTLTNQFGQQVRPSQFRGKIVLLNFIYTHCIDVCPITMAALVKVQNALIRHGWWGTDIVFLSVSTDSQRDTPAVFAQYAKRYQADPRGWHFLTGPLKTVSRVHKAYDIQIREVGRGLQEHHLPTFVIDRGGMVLGAYGVNPNADDVLSDLAQLRAMKSTR